MHLKIFLINLLLKFSITAQSDSIAKGEKKSNAKWIKQLRPQWEVRATEQENCPWRNKAKYE